MQFEQRGELKKSVVAHLDKSHVTAHTYPEYHPDNGISTIRVDIDVSTCGRVSPLKALNYLIDSFDEDIVILDYRVRGFTRDVIGQKHYIDHEITSIQDYLSDKTKNQYQIIDVNVNQENIFIKVLYHLSFCF
jgi:S-adenosylmethionine decarboxylase